MAENDLHSHVKIAMAITPVAATAIADGSDIDTKGFEFKSFIPKRFRISINTPDLDNFDRFLIAGYQGH